MHGLVPDSLILPIFAQNPHPNPLPEGEGAGPGRESRWDPRPKPSPGGRGGTLTPTLSRRERGPDLDVNRGGTLAPTLSWRERRNPHPNPLPEGEGPDLDVNRGGTLAQPSPGGRGGTLTPTLSRREREPDSDGSHWCVEFPAPSRSESQRNKSISRLYLMITDRSGSPLSSTISSCRSWRSL